MKYAVTFGQRYYKEPHPADPRISGNSFVVFEAPTEMGARMQAIGMFGFAWATTYEYADDAGNLLLGFQRQIKEYGLVEVVMKKEN